MMKLVKFILVSFIVGFGIPAFLWLSGFLIFTGTICSMSEPKTYTETDAAIVLTGGTNRVSRGLDLLAENKTKNLFISGVHENVRVQDLLKLWDYKRPAPKCCITLGFEAGNTIGNAKETAEWVNENHAKSLYLVTANYHMPRAMMEFRNTLKGVTIIPFPVQPENFNPRQTLFWKTVFVEYHKLIMTFIRIKLYPKETSPLPQAFTQ